MFSHVRWWWIAAFWFGLGLFDAMQTVLVMRAEGMHHAWPTLFAVTAGSWLPWAIATPLVVWMGRRFPPARRGIAAWATAHIAACAAIGFAFACWTSALKAVFNPYLESPPPAFGAMLFDTFTSGFLSSLVLYAGIVIVTYGLDSRVRLADARTEAARLNEGLVTAKLQALRRQIEPHFLFNALNTVTALVRGGRNDAAVDAIAALSTFLRRMLDETNRPEVSLREELAFVNDYLDIQKLRFADRLRVRIDVPPELHAVFVPHLILQPLVENAIKHGIGTRVDGGEIRISASGGDGRLTLCVGNDGPQLPGGWDAKRAGIGLANVRTRMHDLYGNAYGVTMADGQHSGVDVRLSLPLRDSAPLG